MEKKILMLKDVVLESLYLKEEFREELNQQG
jgi:hypothetical protein